MSAKEMREFCGQKDHTYFKNNVINPLIAEGIVSMTRPETPNSPAQKYYLTEAGKELLFHCQNPEDSSYIDGVVNDSLRTIIYDMQGRRTDHIQKGLNMIHMSDGKTKKVIMLNLR